MCMLVDCYEEYDEKHIHRDVQEVPGSIEDSRCLLDAIWGALTGPGV